MPGKRVLMSAKPVMNFRKRMGLSVWIVLWSGLVSGEPVELQHRDLTLLANIEASAAVASDRQEPVFLIIHGSWAHHGMELPAMLQNLLREAGYHSLAPTLSLGIDRRSGFFDCNQPLTQGHDQALEEIGAWVTYLQTRGYRRIVLLGHSRGGAQVALYARQSAAAELDSSVEALVLLAPMSWQADAVAEAYAERYQRPLTQILAEAQQAVAQRRKLFTPPGTLYCEKLPVSPAAFISYYSDKPEKNTPTLIADTSLPVWVFIGSEDPLSEGMLSQREVLGANPLIAMNVVDGADHFFRDLHADDIVEQLLNALAE